MTNNEGDNQTDLIWKEIYGLKEDIAKVSQNMQTLSQDTRADVQIIKETFAMKMQIIEETMAREVKEMKKVLAAQTGGVNRRTKKSLKWR